MSKVNDTPPIGPHSRPVPVEAHAKQAGGNPRGHDHDVLRLGVSRGMVIPALPSRSPLLASAHLAIVGLVLALVLFAAWWGGGDVLVGVGMGWATGALVWLVRKDLARTFRDLFG